MWLEALAPVMGVPVTALCRPGVLANLALLERHIATLMAQPLEDAVEIAPRFEP